MFTFSKIRRALSSCETRFEIRFFVLLPTKYSCALHAQFSATYHLNKYILKEGSVNDRSILHECLLGWGNLSRENNFNQTFI